MNTVPQSGNNFWSSYSRFCSLKLFPVAQQGTYYNEHRDKEFQA